MCIPLAATGGNASNIDSNMEWDIPDPLSLDTAKQLQLLLDEVPLQSPLRAALEQSLSEHALLPSLSGCLLLPSLTMTIVRRFRPLLMDLCARWLDDMEDMLSKFEALALLIEIHEELFPVLFSLASGGLQKGGPLRGLFEDRPPHKLDTPLLHRTLLAYYRVLRAAPSLPERLNWDLSLLLKLCTAPQLDRGTRWLSIRCYALQSNMSERKRHGMEESLLGELGREDCTIHYGEDISGNPRQADGWLLPVLEVRRIQEYRDEIACGDQHINFLERQSPSLAGGLSPRVANVHAILLLRSTSDEPSPSRLVLTLPARITIRKLAINLSLRRPTLLSSSPSSGKTTILEYLASQLRSSQNAKFVTIHLADTSLDPRALLGSYVSSASRSGIFEWKDGVLVQAMREGKWVLLEDIDRASDDVLSLLLPLLESLADNKSIGARAKLSVPSRGVVEADENFLIFATRSLDVKDIFPSPTFLGAHKWNEIVIPESSVVDLGLIVGSKYPAINGSLSDALIDVWRTVKDLRALSSTRAVGIRDLEKFCARTSRLIGNSHASGLGTNGIYSIAELLPNPNLREELYLETRDVFFAAGTTSQSTISQRNAIARAVGEKLGLSEETCEWVLKRRTPAFDINKDVDGRPISLCCGPNVLPVNRSEKLPGSSQRSFKMHKQAIRLVSQLASCISAIEPVLLTGETGTGKTSVVSHLAALLNKPLTTLNLSTQTESSDLIGGFKPVSAVVPAQELHRTFLELFQKTFSSKKNETFHRSLRKAVNDAKWKNAVKLWNDAASMALEKLKEKYNGDQSSLQAPDQESTFVTTPRKRRKLRENKMISSEADWLTFKEDVRRFEVQHVLDKGRFAFQYMEGPIAKAVREGSWLLLDEMNLASSETLECISELLQGPEASITLTEKGSLEPIPRHPGFRIFACMNPATDVGKKDLPANIREKFTEIDVPPPDEDEEVLLDIISHYVGHLVVADKSAIADIAQFYVSMKRLSVSGKLGDGSGHRPHYSMRTLSRALTFAADSIHYLPLRRALYEGFMMAFAMVLDQPSMDLMLELTDRTLLSSIKNTKHFTTQLPVTPARCPQDAIHFGPFWLTCGENAREEVANYILTPSVQKKLVDLSRIITTKRYPVLIEGPTSSGKTSAIQYLARRTGHSFVRINNHEHTDIQEYIGSYVSEPGSGRLVFKDGLLVRALRRGDWIVLDELNLAPTDVLEALNRLLDDNRELIVPETQEIIKPHPDFMLFATQNPSGVYAGRKALSRALRNRFLEVHFSDVPPDELQEILCQRSRIAPSHSRLIVAVFQELQRRRQTSRIFEGREGFATLRDLFRWADRDAQGIDELARNGYMLLAERSRNTEDKSVVKAVVEDIMKVAIDADRLYDLPNLPTNLPNSIVWTRSLRRLFMLLHKALANNEPVLLVGETGTGKTSVCQVYSLYKGQNMRTVNCHQNTEASDIIGGLRPVRRVDIFESSAVKEALALLKMDTEVARNNIDGFLSRLSTRLNSGIDRTEQQVLATAEGILRRRSALLEWRDGPLVSCMRHGEVFLLDEISLADDSVLERLNSVLEPSRTLTLAERGGENLDQSLMEADAAFKFIATMNPGGDFGKKELSPALRNRFTEIWVPSIMHKDEMSEIIESSWVHEELRQLTKPLLDFVEWFLLKVQDLSVLTLRDVLAWVEFCNVLRSTSGLTVSVLFVQGGHISIIDGIASFSQLSGWSTSSLRSLRTESVLRLKELSPDGPEDSTAITFEFTGDTLRMGPFSMKRGSAAEDLKNVFSFEAPTPVDNAYRLLRACQLARPILLEGNPGVGKTSLVSALAAALGQRLCRINLSEQTDLVDLFGSDLPVEGSITGAFTWNDADFLKALKNGHWVLLDEMNLASQAVLEGLNAIFDHRGTVYIPELDRSFTRHPDFRVFAAQNPLNQGSGRKGLPKSFLNRFTKVFIEQMSTDDYLFICHRLYSKIPLETLRTMIAFNSRLHEEIVVRQNFGLSGSPWEFNLRDLMRWSSLMEQCNMANEPWRFLNTMYWIRFRGKGDKERLLELFREVFQDKQIEDKLAIRCITTSTELKCGSVLLRRGNSSNQLGGTRLLSSQARHYEAAISAITNGWLLIVNGPGRAGKTDFVYSLASLSGQQLDELTLSSTSDTSDLIGSFEQTNIDRQGRHFVDLLLSIIRESIKYVDNSDFRLQEKLLELRSSLQEHVLSKENLRDSGYLLSSLLSEHAQWGDTIRQATDDYYHSQDAELQFAWIDGPLVRAMKDGKWLLLDNANLCSPSVLDRLNPLCEIGGSLVLTEKGSAQEIIRPHVNFRLIMIVDTGRGEVSRAMRNRGIEVYLDATELRNESRTLLSCSRVPPMLESRAADPIHIVTCFELVRRALMPSTKSIHQGEVSLQGTDLPLYDTLSSKLLLHSALLNSFSVTHPKALVFALFETSCTQYDRYLFRLLRQNPAGLVSCISDDYFLLSCNELPSTQKLASLEEDGEGILGDRQPSSVRPYRNWLSPEEAKLFTERAKLLEIYILATLLSKQMGDRKQKQETLTNQGSADSKEAVGSAFQLIEAVCMLALELVGSWSTEYAAINMPSVLQLIRYADYVYNALNHTQPDPAQVYVAMQWMSETTDEAPYAVQQSLRDQVLHMRQHYMLSSGQKLSEIWYAMLPVRPASEDAMHIGKLDALLRNNLSYRKFFRHLFISICQFVGLRYVIRSLDIKRRILDTFSQESGSTLRVEQSDMEKIQQLVRITNTDVDCEDGLNASEYVSPAMRMAVLSMDLLGIVRIYGSKDYLSKVVDIQAHSILFSLNYGRILAYQQLIVQSNTELRDVVAPLAQAHINWHEGIWSEGNPAQASGPPDLFTPIFLRSTTNLCNSLLNCTLKDVYAIDGIFADETRRSLYESLEQLNRHDMVLSSLLQNVAMLLHAIAGNYSEMRQVSSLIRNGTSSSSCLLLSPFLLGKQRMQEKLPSLGMLEDVFRTLEKLEACQQGHERMLLIGGCWITLARTLLDLYIPNLCLDPALIDVQKDAIISAQTSWLQSRIRVYAAIESVQSGCDTNFYIQHLNQQLTDLYSQSEASQSSRRIARETDARALRSFWNEIRVFASDIVFSHRVEDLASADDMGSEAFCAREKLLQSTISNFLHRLKTTYARYEDLLPAVELSLFQFKFGLSLIRFSSSSSLEDGQSLVQDILSFPSSRARQALSDAALQDVAQGQLPISTASLFKLTGIAYSASSAGWNHHLTADVRTVYDSLASLYRQKIFEEEERKRQEDTLYRASTSKVAGDDTSELEDEEIRALFPLYAEEDNDSVTSGSSHVPAQCDTVTGAEFASELVEVHLGIFVPQYTATTGQELQWTNYQAKAALSLSEAQLATLPSEVDEKTTALRMQLLRRSREQIRGEGNLGAYSFYQDPNYREVRKAREILERLRKRLSSLIFMWPDQLVLQHLRDRCDSILSMSIRSPLAKLLGAIERLLIHTEDWEMYANRDNSLTSDRLTLTNVIVDWRKLELSGWRRILEAESGALLKELSFWWFHLYDAVVVGVLAAADDYELPTNDQLGNYLDSLRPLLEDFIRSSPLGQFRKRLLLLNSFALLTSRYASITDTSGKEALTRASYILTSVHHFYSLYFKRTDDYLLEQKSIIEKDIQDLTRLAAWKDINVYALQQSAQRTHKQLYRRIRKFRALIREPVSEHLRLKHAGKIDLSKIELQKMEESKSSSFDITTATTCSASDERIALKKFISVYKKDMVPHFERNDRQSDALESLSKSIFTSQEEYLEAKPQSGLSAEARKRWDASLLNRKRRSWIELLKELKRIGLASSLKPDVLIKQSNRRLLMEQPNFKADMNGPLATLGQKIARYYSLSIGLLSALDQCSARHHLDIGTRELQRGIAYFQSAFFYASSAKSTLVHNMTSMNQMVSLARKLRFSHSSGSSLKGGTTISNAFTVIKARICDLISSLTELSRIAEIIAELNEDDQLVRDLIFHDLKQMIAKGEDIRTRFVMISEDADKCGLLILSEDDILCISSANKYVNDVRGFLADLCRQEPRLVRCSRAIIDWHKSCWISDDTLQYGDESSGECQPDDLIHLLLIVTQGLVALNGSVDGGADGEDDSGHVREQFDFHAKITIALRLDSIVSALLRFFSRLLCQSRLITDKALTQVLPFLDIYLTFAQNCFISYATWTKSLFKLAYIHGNLLLNLADKGFCRAEDETTDESASGRPETADGTGMGTGSGEQNVNDQLQDESQYEGMRSQEDEPDRTDLNDDKALDVDFDLNGELEDGDTHESEDHEDEDNDQPDLDEEFGLNEAGEFDKLDENFWGSEDKDESLNNQESDANSGTKSQAQTEMVAMESEADQEVKHDEKTNSEDKALENEDEHPPLDEEGDTKGSQEEAQSADAPVDELQEKPADVDMEVPQDEQNDSAFEDADSDDMNKANEQPISEEKMTEEQVDDISTTSDAIAEADQHHGQDDLDVESKPHADELSSYDVPDIAAGTQTDTGAEKGGQESGTVDDLHSPENSDLTDTKEIHADKELANKSSADRMDTSNSEEMGQSAVDQGDQPGQHTSDPQQTPVQTASRSLGDASDSVWRRYDEIHDAISHDVLDDVTENEARGVEYAPEDQSSAMQALGPALAEEHADLTQLNVIEEESSIDNVRAKNDAQEDNSFSHSRESNETMQDGPERHAELDADADRMNIDEPPTNEIQGLSTEEKHVLDEEVEMVLKEWQERGQPEHEGHHLWHLYNTLTQTLAFSLCEQLRLILEPTRATRLMGDFRTGKRLNMKKIIPYIASNYTKDKIWLRRVKPSQREYQILISVDDSRSMSETHSVHLAFQTLALVSKALNRLEVGDLAIASFGTSLQVLHGFEDGPFSEQVGTKVIEAFKFQQSATNMHALLEKSIEVLTRARERRSSSADLWQLEIIISDAICQDHEGLRALIRRAEEERILLVFIVIDARGDRTGTQQARDSIVDLRSVTYQTIKGRLQLHEQRYLDTFPFEFFLILNDVETLPDVLSNTLRQFFERISAS